MLYLGSTPSFQSGIKKLDFNSHGGRDHFSLVHPGLSIRAKKCLLIRAQEMSAEKK